MGTGSIISRKITAWIALLAVFMILLAPPLSRAFSPERSTAGIWMEICSSFGDSSQDAPHSGPFQAASSAHCPYCLLHADLLSSPRNVAVVMTVFTVSHFLPRLFYRAPQPLFSWIVAASRAPPVVG